MIRRWLCRLLHKGESLRPSLVGHGALACLRCGAGFVDLADAGLLGLEEHDRALSLEWRARLDAKLRKAEAEPTFAGIMFRVVRGGRRIPAPRTEHVTGERVEGGEVVNFGRLA